MGGSALYAQRGLPMRWPDCPPAVRDTVSAFVDISRLVLGPDFVGVYLHGSLALGGFNPCRSDVDLLVVSQRDSGPAFRRALASWLLEWSGNPYPFEVHVLQLADLHPWRHPAPFTFHYSEAWRERVRDVVARGLDPRDVMPLVDPDLAAHVTVVRARGIALCGEPIERVFPAVPPADYRAAILSDVADPLAAVTADPVYTVLNLCRITRYLLDGSVTGKAEAGEWAAGTFPEPHRQVVAQALAVYRGEAVAMGLPSERLGDFVRYVAPRLGLAPRNAWKRVSWKRDQETRS
ncbi:putative nucleotidyltransferase [Thermaerobacter subterraneus DSM 13965]|uniref:Nucleotidyltransferase n=2 Tax=Thermaerobacter TaxID=73918 RepID=K6PQZ4_9FIRM|nr:putative nucleotidyltransferase [Thermaerobacter subterraneus DSM 13965]